MIPLPDDVEFHEDIHLLTYRPRGLLNERSVDKIVSIVGDLEAKLKGPFHRFFDTLGHDEVELNFRYVIQISLYRVLTYGDRPAVKSAILATDIEDDRTDAVADADDLTRDLLVAADDALGPAKVDDDMAELD